MLSRFVRSVHFASATVIVTLLCGVGSGILGPTIAHAQPKQDDVAKAFFAPKLPANAKEFSQVVNSAKPNDTVILHGYVPLTDGFGPNGSITLVESLTTAEVKPETPAASLKASLTIEDSDGKALTGLENKFGLKAGAEVFVTGTVQSTDGKTTLVVKAKSLHVPRSPLPAGFFAATTPRDPAELSALRKTGGQKVGDEVVIRGRIGGSKDPFIDGRAMFSLIGRGLKACSENTGDMCDTPWDYCCESKTDVAAHSATIQVVDDKGQVLRTDFKGRRGLKELSEIVVIGTIASTDGKAMVVNATSIVVMDK